MFEQTHAFTGTHCDAAVATDGLPALGPVMEPANEPVTERAEPAPAQPENRRFQLPGSIWIGMTSSYAVFFASITLATGGSGHALLAITVSILYTVMFFGLARVIARQAGPDARSPLLRGEPLQTWCGPMNAKAVYGQILVVPAAIAFFGFAIAVICAVVL